jgi:hypothetical protein
MDELSCGETDDACLNHGGIYASDVRPRQYSNLVRRLFSPSIRRSRYFVAAHDSGVRLLLWLRQNKDYIVAQAALFSLHLVQSEVVRAF